ncbi:MAG: hypothetical protein JWM12_3924 [Ilumatobacteraceae bacterium]|nr:hypothetical protein [Ilumatobacteraceae bacterium]
MKVIREHSRVLHIDPVADQEATTRTSSTPATTPGKRIVPPDDSASIGSVIKLVKDYVRQETIGPLRGAGKWLALGAVGAVLLGFATALLVLGVLRLLQTEFHTSFRGQWTHIIPYVVAAAVAIGVIGIAASRIGKKSLEKEL